MNEFNFIEQYLIKNQGDSSVLLGIGDDAAIVRPRPDWDLCISSDMLLAGRHFFVDIKPEDLAHKVLSVNLSDMAAMGAVPKWVLLSVALPVLDKDWLKSFCNRFYALCDEYGVSCIGGFSAKCRKGMVCCVVQPEKAMMFGFRADSVLRQRHCNICWVILFCLRLYSSNASRLYCVRFQG